uniref:Syntaxin-4 (inferred by orthology to a human protein) n=1 Tax=Strongyloides venezuelensis TaxID=75913 RepID=A0A0K0FR51_STRVS
MVKNRLSEFNEYSFNLQAPSVIETPKCSRYLINDNRNNELNKMFTSVATIRNYMLRMETILEIVPEKQSEILLKPGINENINGTLDTLNEEFKDLTKVCMDQIKLWNKEIKNISNNNLTATQRIKKNQIISLNIKMENLLSRYNNYQMTYREKVVKKMTAYYKSLNSMVTEDEVEEFIITGNLNKLSELAILGKNNKEEVLDNIRSRNEHINKLEKNICQLHELYHDLMILTELQGDKVDYISKEVEKTSCDVEKANENLISLKKKKINCIKYYIFFCGTGMLIILFLMVFVTNFLMS